MTSRSSRVLWIAVAVIAVLVGVAVFVAARDGLLRGTDSEVYLATSDSIWDGDGLTVPFTTYTDRYSPREAVEFKGDVPLSQFGPGYPLAISAVRLTGLDGPDATLVLHALLAALDVWLFVLLVRRLTPGAPWWAIGAGLAILIVGPRGANLLFHHVYVASETLFVTLVLASLLLLERATQSNATRDWVYASLAVGGALSTRFAGAGLLLVAVVAALWAAGIRRAVLVGAVSLAPTAAFVAWNTLAGAAGRPIGWHAPVEGAQVLFDTLAEWFSPRGWSWLTLLVLAAVIALIAYVASTRELPRMWALCAGFIAAYLFGVIAAGFLFDRSLPVASRLLEPLQPIVIALFVAAAARVERVAPVIVGAAVIVLALPGLRYTARLERDAIPALAPPQPIALLDDVDESTPIFTNDPLGVYYNSGRSSYLVPRWDDVFTGEFNEALEAQLGEVRGLVCDGGAVVLLRGPSGPDIAAESDIALPRVAEDGTDVLLGCFPTP